MCNSQKIGCESYYLIEGMLEVEDKYQESIALTCEYNNQSNSNVMFNEPPRYENHTSGGERGRLGN